MLLIPREEFHTVFEPFTDQSVGYVTMHGNPGDKMIDRAASQLMDHFGIYHRPVDWHEIKTGEFAAPVDCLLIAGGGNMGNVYREAHEIRQQALSLGIPVSVLPQSFINNHENVSAYERVFVREPISQELDPRFILAPDLALGLEYTVTTSPEFETGIFLRTDYEALFADHPQSLADPVSCCDTLEQYLALAARFRHLITDRLHFAIAGLIAGVRVTLLPNSYHKNHAVHECWLRKLGCEWQDHAEGLAGMDSGTALALSLDLAGRPSQLLPWDCMPRLSPRWHLDSDQENIRLVSEDAENTMQLNPTAGVILDLCQGSYSIRRIATELAGHFRHQPVQVVKNVQSLLQDLFARGCLQMMPTRTSHEDIGRPIAISPYVAIVRQGQPHPVTVTIRPPQQVGNKLRQEATICNPGTADRVVYFETDAGFSDALTTRADPFVLCAINTAMCTGRPLWIRGAETTPSLLNNLDGFQRVWSSWRLDLRKVPIWADQTGEPTPATRPAILAFSGGIDSCYSLYQHVLDPSITTHYRLGGLLTAHGFDIHPADRRGFQAAIMRLKKLLKDIDLELITIETNAREVNPDWGESTHGLVMAASMAFFGEQFGQGIIASSIPYRLLFPWGTNPISDWMTGSDYLPIYHHGADASRLEKVRQLTHWPHALRHARFCWMGGTADSNCGKCRKCIFTAMMLESLGMARDCFEFPPDESEIEHMIQSRPMTPLERFDAAEIHQQVRLIGLENSWTRALDQHLSGYRSDGV